MERNEQFEAMRQKHFAATGRDLYVDVPLSTVALNHRPLGIIAPDVMPILPVQKQSGFVTEFFRKEMLRTERSRRSPGTEANRVTRDVGSRSYFCDNYALKSGVTIEDYHNADPVKRAVLFDNAAKFVKHKLDLGWEGRIASLISTSNVGSSAGVASAWNGAGNPLGNINTAIDVVKDLSGVAPNRILFGEKAWKSFRRDSNVRNIINGTNNGGGYANEKQVAALLDISKVIVSRASKNTANEAAAEALSQVIADHVLVYYSDDTVSDEMMAWALSHRWEVPGVPSMQAERLPYNAATKSWDVEVGYYQDEKVVAPELGYMLIAVNSST